jgi:guanylate kinase
MHIKKNVFIVITGPSGAGKTTITKALIDNTADSTRLITTTTREKRLEETDGVDYDFITTQQFLEMKTKGEFFECAQVYDQYYGSRKTKLKELFKNYSTVFSVVDVKGAQKIKRKMPSAITIFISPSSINELTARLCKRTTTSETDLKNRIKKAKYEISIANEFDVVIENIDGELENTIDNALLYINKNRQK